MANPLRILRRHQKLGLAVLCIVVTVTWGIGTALQNLTESRPGESVNDRSTVVATWKLGQITRSDLDRMGWEHEAVVRFLYSVVERAQKEGASPQAPFLNIQQDQVDLGIDMSNSDPALVQTQLMAQKAQEMGIVVDQQSMMDYLRNLGGFAISDEQLLEMAREAASQRRDPLTGMYLVNSKQLLDRLREELAARQAREMFFSGLDGFSTGELWEYHGQLHRRYKIEAYPLDVASYQGKFKESDAKEEDLQKIYQEGKDRFPHPEFHEPGFRKPLRLAFGYVKSDFQKFLKAAKEKIPEEQVVEEYNKEVAAGNFRKPKLEIPVSPMGEQPAPAGTEPSTEKPSESRAEKPAEKPAESPATKDAESPASEDKPAGEDKSCQDESAQKTANDAQPAEEKPAADKPAADKSAENPQPGDKPAVDAEAKKIDDKETDAESKPAEPEIRPLSEVRDQILNRLARPEAQAASDAAVKAVTRAVQDYANRYARFTESKKAGGKTSIKDPGELQIRALAEKYYMTVGSTPLSDQFEIASTELGSQAAIFGIRGAVQFAEAAYSDTRPLYSPQEASSLTDEATFIYWRTQEEPSAEVPYEKAREQVVQAWIKQQAVEAARKEAQQIAEKGSQAASLREVLTEEQAKQVVEPLPFSWLTRGSQPIAFSGVLPQLTVVPGISLAGEEFMKEVFELKVGQAGVALNQSHSTVYVVRVLAEEPALDIRREMFLQGLQAGLFGDLVQYALQARRGVMTDVVSELREEYDLKWQESPRFDPEM